MNDTVATPTDGRTAVNTAFQLGLDAGQALAEQRQRLTNLAETAYDCVLPGCIADHDTEETCHTDLTASGPVSTGLAHSEQHGWSLDVFLRGEPEHLDLEETAKLVRTLNRQFRHMLTLAGAR